MRWVGFAVFLLGVGVAAGSIPQRPSAEKDPGTVRGVTVSHRAGQTFVRWQEVVLVPRQEFTAAQLSDARERVERAARIRYRIYRSPRPIQRREDAALIGEVSPFSGLNADHFGRAAPQGVLLPRFVVEEGAPPLSAGTALFVFNAPAPGPAYYLVTVSSNGQENTTLTAENVSADPVTETVSPGAPVLQRTEKPREFQYVSGATLRYYVRWETSVHSALPGMPHNYLVAIPPGVREPAPVGIHLHCWGASMSDCYGWWFNAGRGAVLVSSNLEPYDWWTGYHELFWKAGPPLPEEWKRGVVRPYTQRRLLGFVDWLATTMKLDLSRLFAAGNSTGGSGAIMLAIRYPDRIAWTVSWVGVHVPSGTPQFLSSYEDVYGKEEWGVRFEDGTPVWNHFNDAWYLRQHPDRDIGLITFSNGKNDSAIGWGQAVEFFKALQETRQPHIFWWGQDGHGQRAWMPARGGERDNPLDLRTDLSLPAFTRGTLDDDPGSGTPETGASAGQANYYLTWDPASIVDEPNRWAVSISVVEGAPRPAGAVDVTPRRLQRFKLKAGETVSWTNAAGGTVLQKGEAIADQWGLITLPQVQVRSSGTRVTVTRQ